MNSNPVVTMQVQVEVKFKWYFELVAIPCVLLGLHVPAWTYAVEVK